MSVQLHTRERIEAAKISVNLIDIIGRSVKLRRDGKNFVGLCPFHDEKTPSFYVYYDHYHCYGCRAHGDIFDWLEHTAGMSFSEAVAYLDGGVGNWQAIAPPPSRTIPKPDDKPKRLELARRIWIEATDPRNTLVEVYLESRGLRLPDEPVIRFHPACPCGPDRRPAMIALMVDPVGGEPCGAHRTFLRPDGAGKADILKAKMALGRWGVIRLYEPAGEGIGIAEGIENALTVTQVFQWGPCWATGCSRQVATFPVLEHRALTIFGDRDEAGCKALATCRARWIEAGQEVSWYLPPARGDWNDLIRRRGS